MASAGQKLTTWVSQTDKNYMSSQRGTRDDEAKMVVGLVLSSWLIIWLIGQLMSILRSSMQLSIVLLLLVAYFYTYPMDFTKSSYYNTFSRNLRRQGLPQILSPLKKSARLGLTFIADKLYDFSDYLK